MKKKKKKKKKKKREYLDIDYWITTKPMGLVSFTYSFQVLKFQTSSWGTP